jgi:hypothetical protein
MLLKHQPWNPPEMSCEAVPEFEWNCWKTRQHPFNDLEVGDSVLTVTGGGPNEGRIMNDALIVELVKGHYESLDAAWALIETGFDAGVLSDFGITRDTFVGSAYTRKAPQEGWLLAWWSYPEFIIDQPRPEGLRFRPNGWAELPDADLKYLYEGAIEVQE